MRTRRPRLGPVPQSAFAGFRFPPEVIVLAVHWYLRFGLSYPDLEERLTERGVEVDHVTVYRWVLRVTPLLAEAARPCRHAVGDCWSVDETYVRVAGQWRYLYRAIDQFGQVIDVFIATRRDATAARRFVEQAIGTTKVRPAGITTDRAPGYPAVLEELRHLHGIAPTSTPTTGSRPIMGASSRGRGRCAASSRTVPPG
jgi:transposase-like protein